MLGHYKRKILLNVSVFALLLGAFSILRPTQTSIQDFESLQVQYYTGALDEGPTFLLSSHDHDVDSSKIDFSSISYLKINNDQLIPAQNWRLLQSGHHFQGKLYFQPLTLPSQNEIKLIIKANSSEGEIALKWPDA